MGRNLLKTLRRGLLGFLFVIPFLFSSNSAQATHVMGADITYKCIDTLKFKITIKYYRWCNGVSFSNPSSASRVRCVSGGSGTVGLSLSLESIKEITPVCATATGECVPSNTYGTGEGIEQHTYSVVVDFRDSNSTFYNLRNCCRVIIETGQCCRNSNINTGAANANFYTYAEINLCEAPCNSSPSLTSEPIAILCCNQPFFFNNGASDTTDFDSLSYEWANPLSAFGTNIGYSGLWYAYNHPFRAYYPGSLTPPYKNPNTNPPIGITLDPQTGDIIFTPTRCDEVTVAVIQVNEYRKDSTGAYKKIGVTRRDMQFITRTCPDNNPPVINGPYSYSVCAGSSICFNITTNDPVFVPPPPAQAPAPDSVKIKWNRGIPGATFTIINPTARLQTGQFCWTPSINQASDLPYQFTVTARDNACPLNAVTVRSFSVKVKHRAEAERDIDTLLCGEYAVESNPILGFRGTPSYRWEILDSLGRIVIDPRTAKFRNGSFLSFTKQDTLLFRRGGTYIIRHVINNSPNNCPTTYLDTLVVPPLLEANLSLGPDTFICAGTTLRLEPYIYNETPPVSYQWSTMGVDDNGNLIDNEVTNAGDTLPYFDITVPGYAVDTVVRIVIQDASGCYTEDAISVFLKENPKVTLPPDMRICTYDSVLIIPTYDTAFWVDPATTDTIRQGDTLWKEWYLNSAILPFSTADSNTLNIRGQYVLKVWDSLGCYDYDTMNLFVNDTVTAFAGPDQTLCFNDSFYLTAQGLDTVGNNKSGLYGWYNINNIPRTFMGNATQYHLRASTTTTYQLELYVTEDGVQCFDDDSVTITVNPLPIINIDKVIEECCDYGNISLNFMIKSAKGGTWSCWEYPQLVNGSSFQTSTACDLINRPVERKIETYVAYTYTDPTTGCVNSDSIKTTIHDLPRLMLKEDVVICQDEEYFDMKDKLVTSPAVYLGRPSWKCLECNGNDFSNMLVDSGFLLNPDFKLFIGPDYYTLVNPDRDTITLEFTYINERGCTSVDTVDVEIWKVPTISFDFEDLCWDEGVINLDDHNSVNPLGGTWVCVDTTVNGTNYNCNGLGGITGGNTINTTNSNNEINRGRYWLRYYHDASGCAVWRDSILTINPLPQITLTDLDRAIYCQTLDDEVLGSNPTGGTWTSSDPAALINGNTFSPGNATVFDTDIILKYTFTSPTTGCSNADSLSAQVVKQPTLGSLPDTFFCRPQGQTSMQLTFPVESEDVDADEVGYNTVGVFNNQWRYNIDAASNQNQVIVNLTDMVADSSETYRVIAYTFLDGIAVTGCSDLVESFDIVVHPLPDGRIVPIDSNGCNPVDADFSIVFNNKIDAANSNYDWDLGIGGTSTSPTPSATYNIDGPHNVSVTVESEHGCKSTFTNVVDVYPLPTAKFVPNPNNYTTAALPMFRFNDESTVNDPNYGSTVTEWFYEFGDGSTSTEQNPGYRYPADTMTYNVRLTATTNYGCTNEFEYPVVIGPDLTVFVPNAFTPGTSGPDENNGFHAIIRGEKTVELIIFNRWGEIVFQSFDKEEEWDGTYQGELVQQDVYAYQLKVTALDDELYTFSGTITVIR